MSNVWVIEQGEYSDYRVVGVYTTEENAQKVCDLLNDGDEYSTASVAEWPLDPTITELNQGMTFWHVAMLKNGDTERVEQVGIQSYRLNSEFNLWRRSKAPLYQMRNMPDVLQAWVWAGDAQHAVKIANEKRAEWIATGKWGG
jgi:hypothetical protein